MEGPSTLGQFIFPPAENKYGLYYSVPFNYKDAANVTWETYRNDITGINLEIWSNSTGNSWWMSKYSLSSCHLHNLHGGVAMLSRSWKSPVLTSSLYSYWNGRKHHFTSLSREWLTTIYLPERRRRQALVVCAMGHGVHPRRRHLAELLELTLQRHLRRYPRGHVRATGRHVNRQC